MSSLIFLKFIVLLACMIIAGHASRHVRISSEPLQTKSSFQSHTPVNVVNALPVPLPHGRAIVTGAFNPLRQLATALLAKHTLALARPYRLSSSISAGRFRRGSPRAQYSGGSPLYKQLVSRVNSGGRELSTAPGEETRQDNKKKYQKRPSAIKFWRFDISSGAGAISSPVIAEHPRTAAGAACFWERTASELLEDVPPWFLYSALGVVTREIASRQVQEGAVQVNKDPEARRKASKLTKKLRSGFDDRIQRALEPGAYGSANRFVRRIIDQELIELSGTVEAIDRVVWEEITPAIQDIFATEIVSRIQNSLTDAVLLNETSAEADLSDLMRRADADGNEMITFDEMWELVTGMPLVPAVAEWAQNVPVLKSAQTAANRWDQMVSLLLAPRLKDLTMLGAEGRKFWDAIERRSEFERNRFMPIIQKATDEVLQNYVLNNEDVQGFLVDVRQMLNLPKALPAPVQNRSNLPSVVRLDGRFSRLCKKMRRFVMSPWHSVICRSLRRLVLSPWRFIARIIKIQLPNSTVESVATS
jgi:hypothetical protein